MGYVYTYAGDNILYRNIVSIIRIYISQIGIKKIKILQKFANISPNLPFYIYDLYMDIIIPIEDINIPI